MNRYRFLAVIVFLVLADFAGAAEPQEDEESYPRRVQGYAFFAPGIRPNDGESLFSAGGGVDWLFGKWFGAGLDTHFFLFWDCSDCGAFVITANANIIRRRATAADKWEPFARFGVGGAGTGDGGLSAIAFGGGTNYWARERTAIRLEVRGEYFFEGDTYLFFRVGAAF